MKRSLALFVLALLLEAASATTARVDPLPVLVTPVKYQLQIEPDPQLRTFSGQASLEFEVASDRVRVVVNSAQLDILSARVDDQQDVPFSYEPAQQRLIFEVPEGLRAGRHILRVHYRGQIGERGPGLQRVQQRGDTAAYLYSALCCGDYTRYLAPLWDEGGDKAVIELSLIGADDISASSTMPIIERQPVGDGKVRLVFPPTPPMPPRLFFLAMGPFEKFSRVADGLEVAVVVPRGLEVNADLVMSTTVDAARYLGSYLGMPYPLAKLDAVLLPNAPGGAISNWGAIQYAQRYLTVRRSNATREQLQISYALIAHEVSHQWFGNLVTPFDRSHGWLSEGFAVWMENRISEILHPDWPSWLHASEYRDAAMRLDAQGLTHPVVLDRAVVGMDSPPDTEIIYDKAAQVLRMMEAYVGEQEFRAGVRDYVARHAYGRVVNGDLWRAIAAASSPLAAGIGKDFTEQAGLPLIDVKMGSCTNGGSTITLRQQRFETNVPDDVGRNWRVPVAAAIVGQSTRHYRVVSGPKAHKLRLAGCGVVKVNPGGIGYFRTRYDSRSLAGIRSVFSSLPAVDQLGLLQDQLALAEAGHAPFGEYLALVSRLTGRSDPMVSLQWVRAAGSLDHLYRGGSAEGAFRDFARNRFGTMLNEVGWESRDGEPAHLPLLRVALIELLGQLRHPAVHAEAARRFTAANRLMELSPLLREPIMKVLGAGFDEAAVHEWLGRVQHTSDPQEQQLYWLALSAVTQRGAALLVLDRVATDVSIDGELRRRVLVELAARHPEEVYERVQAGSDARDASDGQLLIDVARNSADARIAERLRRFLSDSPLRRSRGLSRALDDILHRDELRRARLPSARALAAAAGYPQQSRSAQRVDGRAIAKTRE